MPGQKQSKETQAQKPIQTKKKPAAELGPIGAQSNIEGGPEPLFTSVADASIQRQAAQLSDPRFSREGQQRLAGQIGKIGGNRHLQRVMVQMRRAKPAPEEKEPLKAPVKTGIEMDKQEFLNFCSEANTKIDNAYKAARKWLIGLSIAYGDAYKKHTDTLSDTAERYRLTESLVLGAVFAFVPGGAGGLIGASMKRKAQGDFMVDGVKDLAKWGMRTSPSLAGNQPGNDGFRAFPTDPLQWRNHVEQSVEAESLAIGRILESWQHRTNQNDPNFYRDFNPVEKVEEALKIAGTRLEALPAVDQKATADDFERGMWTAWLEQFGYILMDEPMTLDSKLVIENLPKEVEERCKELGIDVQKYALVAKEAAEKQLEAHNKARDEAYNKRPTVRWRKSLRQLLGERYGQPTIG